jgi:nicotinamidase-related amidase
MKSHSALIIIDMISAFDFPEANALRPSLLRTARRIAVLKAHFRRQHAPVIYANDNFANWRADFRELVTMAAASGGVGRKVAALLQPEPDDYFVLKPKHSAFLATALPVLLAKLGVNEVVLTGMTADSCVMATAIDANAREYRVTVVRDAVAGLPARKRAAFEVLAQSKAAVLVSSSTVMRQR